MQEKHLYEYAIIRVVPRVEREEFINVGIIMFSKRCKFLKVKCHVNEAKLAMYSSEFDLDTLYKNLEAFDSICSGGKKGGVIGSFDVIERFRWLTAVRSSSIQTSRPHMGFSEDLESTFNHLFTELVE